MRIIPCFILFVIVFSTVCCNPIGDVLIEGETVSKIEEESLVYTMDGLKLEAGDVIVVWGKYSDVFMENDEISVYTLKYNLSLGDSTIDNSVVKMFDHRDYMINSTRRVRDDREKLDWRFEQKVIEIPIKKSGTYTFDYKLSHADNPNRYLSPKVSLIISKL